MCKGFNKFYLFAVNIVFFVLGIAILAIGIWTTASENSLAAAAEVIVTKARTSDLAELKMAEQAMGIVRKLGIALIVIGGIAFLAAAFGCCGGCRENKCMLYIYSGFVILVVLLQILCAIVAGGYISKTPIDKNAFVNLEKKFFLPITSLSGNSSRKGDLNYTISNILTTVHIQLGCCGANGPQDITDKDSLWTKSSNGTTYDPKHTKSLEYPVTCCKLDKEMKNPTVGYFAGLADKDCPNKKMAKQTDPLPGCYKTIKDKVERYLLIITITGILFALLQATCIIAACCLIRQINETDFKN